MRSIILLIFIALLSFNVIAIQEFNLGTFNILADYLVPAGPGAYRAFFENGIQLSFTTGEGIEKAVNIENIRGTISEEGIITGKTLEDTKIGNTFVKKDSVFDYDVINENLVVKEGSLDYGNAKLLVEKGSLLNIAKDKITATGEFTYNDLKFKVPKDKLISIGSIPNEDDYLAILHQDDYNFLIDCKGKCESIMGTTKIVGKYADSCVEEVFKPSYKCLSSELLTPHYTFKRIGGEDTEVLDALDIKDGLIEVDKGGIKLTSKAGDSFFIDPNSLNNKIPTSTNLYVKNNGVLSISHLGEILKENDLDLTYSSIMTDNVNVINKAKTLGQHILPIRFLDNIQLLKTWEGAIPKEVEIANAQILEENIKSLQPEFTKPYYEALLEKLENIPKEQRSSSLTEYMNVLNHNSEISRRMAIEGATEIGTEGVLVVAGGKLLKPVAETFSPYISTVIREGAENFIPSTKRYYSLIDLGLPKEIAKVVSKSEDEFELLLRGGSYGYGSTEWIKYAKSYPEIGKVGAGEFVLGDIPYNYLDKFLASEFPTAGNYGYGFGGMINEKVATKVESDLIERGVSQNYAHEIVTRLFSSREPIILARVPDLKPGSFPETIFHERGHAGLGNDINIFRKAEAFGQISAHIDKIDKNPGASITLPYLNAQDLKAKGYQESQIPEELVVNAVAQKRVGYPFLFDSLKALNFRPLDTMLEKAYEGTFKPLPAVIGTGAIQSLSDLFGRIDSTKIIHND